VAVVAKDPFENGVYRGASQWLADRPTLFEKLEDGPILWLFRANQDALEIQSEPADRSEFFSAPDVGPSRPGIPSIDLTRAGRPTDD
jgi:hypothetical protein